jgi:hypothetical protein
MMAFLDLGQLPFEGLHRPFAGMMIPPVGEQNTADIQKQAGDRGIFATIFMHRRSDHRCHRIRASS